MSGQLIPISDVARDMVQQSTKTGIREFLETYSAAQVDGAISSALGGSFQPLDSDLTAIAQLGTTPFGRQLLTQVDAAAVRSYIGAGTSNFGGGFGQLDGIPNSLAGYGITDAQAKNATLDLLAALTTTAYGRSFLSIADSNAFLDMIVALLRTRQVDQPFTGSITWTGTTAPSGTATTRWSWVKIIDLVQFNFRFEWTTQGNSLSGMQFDFPSGFPPIATMTGQSNSEVALVVNGIAGGLNLGGVSTGNTMTARIQLNASGAMEAHVRFASTNVGFAQINGVYRCQ